MGPAKRGCSTLKKKGKRGERGWIKPIGEWVKKEERRRFVLGYCSRGALEDLK